MEAVLDAPELMSRHEVREATGKARAADQSEWLTARGVPVSYRRLRDRFEEARAEAAKAFPALADGIKGMILRDMRKRAADLAEDDGHASKLLQHSSESVTRKHYRTKGAKLKAVR